MNSLKSENRPNYLDWAKVLGIYIVIFGHYTGLLIPFSNNLLWNITNNIASFHMQLFFIIAGVLFKVRPIKEEFYKSVHRLLVPYFIISVICLIIYTVINDVSVKQFIKNIIGILSGYDFFHYAGFGEISGPLWFVWSLFCIKIVISLYYHLIKIKKHLLAYGMLVLCCITAIITIFKGAVFPFRIDSSSIGLLFFIIGFKGKYYFEKINLLNIRYLSLVSGIALLILVISTHFNINYDDINSKPSINWCKWGNNFILYVISGISGSVMIFSLSRLISDFKSNIILNLSNGTMLILAFNYFFIQFFKGIIKSDNFFIAVLFSLFIMFLCYIIILLSKKYLPILLDGKIVKI